MIYPGNFEEKVGFTRIREMVREACLCDLGRVRAEEMGFIVSPETLFPLLDQADEFREILLRQEEFPLDHYLDMTNSLRKLGIEGAYLEAEEFFNLRRSQATIRSILSFFNSREEQEYPALRTLCYEVKVFPYVIEAIDRVLTGKGEVRDKASPGLYRIRRELADKQKSVTARLQAILKQSQADGWVEQGVTLSIRNGRAVIPINASFKRNIRGFVHDESATGKTVYVEPAEIVELNNEIRELEYEEHREIIRILVSLTDAIRPYAGDLSRSYDFLGTMDFIRAKALVARKLDAVKPGITTAPGLNWQQAFHPLLLLTHRPEGKEVVSLDISLDPETRMLLISGPNAGGKSVCLQTVGLLQYMLQCGMLVPASDNSEFGIFEDLFIEIGDEQSIENDLSTYSSHLVNMKFYLKHAGERSLILIDEFGTGTEPMLGGAIAEAVLGKLIRSGAYGVLTTHYTNLKHYASAEPGIVNGAMLFDRQRMQPLFRLEAGRPGSSFAFEIARKIGLPEEILREATRRVGEDHITFDKHLQEIARDKRYWENKRQRIRKSEKKLEELVEKYSAELKDIRQLRSEIIGKADREARELLSGVNRAIENTIRKIKETNAERETTRQARLELEQMRKEVLDDPLKTDETVERKIRQLKRREQQLKGRAPATEEPEKKKPVQPEDRKIRIGDKVKMAGQETPGEVIDLSQKNCVVSFGNMITTLPAGKLVIISEGEYREATRSMGQDPSTIWDLSRRKLDFAPQIDIRGTRTEEAIRRVSEFIDEAIVVEAGTLRILHGKGDGILRQMVREYLHTIDLVKSFKDEHLDQGGSGITVVEMDF